MREARVVELIDMGVVLRSRAHAFALSDDPEGMTPAQGLTVAVLQAEVVTSDLLRLQVRWPDAGADECGDEMAYRGRFAVWWAPADAGMAGVA